MLTSIFTIFREDPCPLLKVPNSFLRILCNVVFLPMSKLSNTRDHFPCRRRDGMTHAARTRLLSRKNFRSNVVLCTFLANISKLKVSVEVLSKTSICGLGRSRQPSPAQPSVRRCFARQRPAARRAEEVGRCSC